MRILPGTGRGTMRSMVERAHASMLASLASGRIVPRTILEHAGHVRPEAPLHQPSAGPPPRPGEDWS